MSSEYFGDRETPVECLTIAVTLLEQTLWALGDAYEDMDDDDIDAQKIKKLWERCALLMADVENVQNRLAAPYPAPEDFA